jgi:hypothetical protein
MNIEGLIPAEIPRAAPDATLGLLAHLARSGDAPRRHEGQSAGGTSPVEGPWR